MTGYTDIAATGWVARMPAAWRPYILLARADRPIGVWLLFLPGLWGIDGRYPMIERQWPKVLEFLMKLKMEIPHTI